MSCLFQTFRKLLPSSYYHFSWAPYQKKSVRYRRKMAKKNKKAGGFVPIHLFLFSFLSSSLGMSPLCMGVVWDVVVAGGEVIVIEKEKNGKGVFICTGTADEGVVWSEHRAVVVAIGWLTLGAAGPEPSLYFEIVCWRRLNTQMCRHSGENPGIDPDDICWGC